MNETPRLEDLEPISFDLDDILIEKELDVLRKMARHPLSQDMDRNDVVDESKYIVFLEGYQTSEHLSSLERHDFIDKRNINLGWKVHLDVAPENVKEVSDYLIENGYIHKYLSGGEVDSGKVFTVYIGSREKTAVETKKLSKELEHVLAKPKDKNEIEFAKGVVGRFSVGRPLEFRKYGTSGMDTLLAADWLSPEVIGQKVPQKKIMRSELKTYERLKELYGTYFTGIKN